MNLSHKNGALKSYMDPFFCALFCWVICEKLCLWPLFDSRCRTPVLAHPSQCLRRHWGPIFPILTLSCVILHGVHVSCGFCVPRFVWCAHIHHHHTTNPFLTSLKPTQINRKWPQCRDVVDTIQFGTPLSAEHYINAIKGESYGLHSSMERYFDFEIGRSLNPKTPIPGLWLSGQGINPSLFVSV